MYQHLLYSVENGVGRITINRPESYNALSGELLGELLMAVQATAEDDTVRVVVLTGTGDKAFSSGADLKAAMRAGMGLGDSLRKNYNPLIMAIRELPKPVICRLNGIAAGAGCSLALACDLIVAAETSAMSQIFMNIGLIPDAGSLFFLPRLIGPQKTFELMSTARIVPAAECLALGLVVEVVPFDELDAAVQRRTDFYTNAPTKSIGFLKKILNGAFQEDLQTILEQEATHQELAGRTHDAAEGIAAFLQKRKPNYKGK